MKETARNELDSLCGAGLVMQHHSADSSLHANIQHTLQLVCSGSVAAFCNSQASASDSSQSAAKLLAAVATASAARSAEVQRHMAESQKVLKASLYYF